MLRNPQGGGRECFQVNEKTNNKARTTTFNGLKINRNMMVIVCVCVSVCVCVCVFGCVFFPAFVVMFHKLLSSTRIQSHPIKNSPEGALVNRFF